MHLGHVSTPASSPFWKTVWYRLGCRCFAPMVEHRRYLTVWGPSWHHFPLGSLRLYSSISSPQEDGIISSILEGQIMLSVGEGHMYWDSSVVTVARGIGITATGQPPTDMVSHTIFKTLGFISIHFSSTWLMLRYSCIHSIHSPMDEQQSTLCHLFPNRWYLLLT